MTGCYFHLAQSILRKVNDAGLKADYESDNIIRQFIRSLMASSHVPLDDVVTVFDHIVQNEMPRDERIDDVVTYLERTYIRGRRRPGRVEQYNAAIFPPAVWNKFEDAGDGIARTTNAVEGWHFSLQALFLCQHPNMWTFLEGIRHDCNLHLASFLRAATGAQHVGKKKYRTLKERVARTVAGYGQTDQLTYLHAIAHLSHA